MIDAEQGQGDIDQEALNIFGEYAMRMVRDWAISQYDKTIDRELKEPGCCGYPELISLSQQQFELVRRLVPNIVDTTIHYMMYALNETDAIDIAVHTSTGNVPNLREVSNESIGGLHFELYGPEGWLVRFSKQRPSKLFPQVPNEG